MDVDLSFLGDCEAMLFRDGVNADRKASDYKRETFRIDTSKSLTVHLAPGGGFAMRLKPEKTGGMKKR